ncbi:conjugal transfer protein TraL [Variovorax sp. 770b2]|uniref:conjugal transfer protein TraL n=1 Tax=Variovorax sp. 770b2 TaxID=1566271 RepID=UPI00210B86FF|nr:conjugal transfer protein TraL [Variovorax sp. 770b2]
MIEERSSELAPAASVHLMLQGKGGVGKSLCSAFLAQFLNSVRDTPTTCIDTDPNNQTFCGYAGLNVSPVSLLDGPRVNERRFDELMERLLTESGTFVIDNGSSSFLPLSNYLVENQAFSMLRGAGRQIFIHTVVTGGQALVDTMSGFNALGRNMAEGSDMVVWVNEFFGPIERDGKNFAEMRAYKENASKVRGVVRIPRRNPDTFGRDVEAMAAQRLTFEQVDADPRFSIMSKQRLRTIQRELFMQLTELDF